MGYRPETVVYFHQEILVPRHGQQVSPAEKNPSHFVPPSLPASLASLLPYFLTFFLASLPCELWTIAAENQCPIQLFPLPGMLRPSIVDMRGYMVSKTTAMHDYDSHPPPPPAFPLCTTPPPYIKCWCPLSPYYCSHACPCVLALVVLHVCVYVFLFTVL